jgi:hypothetical protein
MLIKELKTEYIPDIISVFIWLYMFCIKRLESITLAVERKNIIKEIQKYCAVVIGFRCSSTFDFHSPKLPVLSMTLFGFIFKINSKVKNRIIQLKIYRVLDFINSHLFWDITQKIRLINILI